MTILASFGENDLFQTCLGLTTFFVIEIDALSRAKEKATFFFKIRKGSFRTGGHCQTKDSTLAIFSMVKERFSTA